MKITNIEKIEKDSNYCDITTATENFYIKVGSKELLVHNSPALFCYSKFPGYPDNSICLKSFVANANNVLSSEEEIEERYGDRAEMAEKLKFGLELAKYIPEGECWQGDCLFTQRDLKEQEIDAALGSGQPLILHAVDVAQVGSGKRGTHRKLSAERAGFEPGRRLNREHSKRCRGASHGFIRYTGECV